MSRQVNKIIEPVVQALTDSKRTYAAAVGRVGASPLERVFREIADRREWFASRLQVSIDGGTTPSRSLTEALREWWMAVRDQLADDDDPLLAELERVEDAMLVHYRRALAASDLPEDLARLLREQLGEIEETHDRIRGLRNSERAARQA